MRPLCIYHGNCADGFTSAWVVRQAFHGDVDFHAGVYQEPPPNVNTAAAGIAMQAGSRFLST